MLFKSNIPFHYPQEMFPTNFVPQVGLVPPYSLNYHSDETGKFRGFVFANFDDPRDANAALERMDSHNLQGRVLHVEEANCGRREKVVRESHSTRRDLRMRHQQTSDLQHLSPLDPQVRKRELDKPDATS